MFIWFEIQPSKVGAQFTFLFHTRLMHLSIKVNRKKKKAKIIGNPIFQALTKYVCIAQTTIMGALLLFSFPVYNILELAF